MAKMRIDWKSFSIGCGVGAVALVGLCAIPVIGDIPVSAITKMRSLISSKKAGK